VHAAVGLSSGPSISTSSTGTGAGRVTVRVFCVSTALRMFSPDSTGRIVFKQQLGKLQGALHADASGRERAHVTLEEVLAGCVVEIDENAGWGT